MPANDAAVDGRIRDLEARQKETEARVRVIEIDNAGTKTWMTYVTEQLVTFVTKTEFGPVKMIAYGIATTALSMIITALFARIILK